MDRLGLLTAAAAVLAFPGGVYVAGLTVVSGRAAAMGGLRRAWPPAAAAGAVLAVVAAALAPLPGSPSAALPDRGAPADVVAAVLLVAGAVGLVGPPRWDAVRAVAAAAAAVPTLVLAAAAATDSLPVLAGLGDGPLLGARVFAGVAAVLAAPLVAGDRDPAVPAAARALVQATVVLLGAALALPPAVGRLPGVVGAAVAAAVVVAVGAASRLALGRRPLLALPAVLCGVAAVVFAVAGRG